jgi:hypothetical protein
VREERGLGVLGPRELVRGAVEHQAGEREAQERVGFGEGVPRLAMGRGEAPAHAHRL